MSQQNIKQPPLTPERESEIAQARADLLRRAEEQGVKPIIDFADLRGDSEFTAELDVDEFLRITRETRDTPSSQRDG